MKKVSDPLRWDVRDRPPSLLGPRYLSREVTLPVVMADLGRLNRVESMEELERFAADGGSPGGLPQEFALGRR